MSESRRTVVFVGGGLGDVARRFYLSDTYELLGQFTSPATVLCYSHNPSALDFFRFHPNANNLVLMDAGHIYMALLHDQSVPRKEINTRLFAICGLAGANFIARRREPNPIGHFHALDAITDCGPYIVIHPFGRGWGDWPVALCETVKRALPRNTRAYVITADYTAADGRRKTESFPAADDNVRVLKNLSAPAAFSLVARAARFIGTMSALAQVAAFEQVPSLILHPKRCKDFQPPYSDYSRTIWNANGVALSYDTTPPQMMDDALRLFVESPSKQPLLRETFQWLAPVPVG